LRVACSPTNCESEFARFVAVMQPLTPCANPEAQHPPAEPGVRSRRSTGACTAVSEKRRRHGSLPEHWAIYQLLEVETSPRLAQGQRQIRPLRT
jgi:hypothetical protein